MIAACHTTMLSTRMIYCLWHGTKNLKKNLKAPLGAQWDPFLSDFASTCHSVTKGEFDSKWHILHNKYGNSNKDNDKNKQIKEYLERLYSYRFNWAWVWTRTVFTAGMQSTQRAEKENHLVKLLRINSKSTLADVVQATTARTQKQLFQTIWAETKAGVKAKDESVGGLDQAVVKREFHRILQTNEVNLDSFAHNRMKAQMGWAMSYS
ncbi:hypothetical protein BGZ82_004232, partial [Podila clonocystis]